MSQDAGGSPRGRPVAVVKLGGLTPTGALAIAAILVILGLVVALVWTARPSLKMLLSAAIWIAFVVYWGVAARNAATARSSESDGSRKLHQALMNGSLALLFLPVPGLRWRFLPAARSLAAPGLGLQAGFALFAAWARRHLGRNWSGEVAIKEDPRLARTGPYRLLRHPIYTAMLGMFLGTAVVSGELHALLALAVMSGAYVRKIRIEERALLETFGADYETYRRESWSVLPGIC